MSRKKTQPKKSIVPDPKFNSTIIPKLINNIMYDGKRGVAAKIVYDAIEKIKTKIVFSTIIELLNKEADKENIEKIVLINVPSEIYSDLRKIFINLFENSGFNDVKINENVDFEKLYKMKKSQ